jgi:hypothetical protein
MTTSVLFNFSWSKKLLISTSQGNDPLAPDFHIKDTTRIKTLFNLNSNWLDIPHKELKEGATFYSRESPTKNAHYSLFSERIGIWMIYLFINFNNPNISIFMT